MQTYESFNLYLNKFIEFENVYYFNYDNIYKNVSYKTYTNVELNKKINEILSNHFFPYTINFMYDWDNIYINAIRFILVKNSYAKFIIQNMHYFFFFVGIIYGLSIVFVLFSKQIIRFYNNSTLVFIIKRFFNQIEQQIGNFEDFMLLIILFSIIFLLNFCYFYNFNIGKIFNYFMTICLFFSIVIPARIIFYFGNSFIVYIKGSSLYKKSKVELIYDLTNLFAFFLRFLLQLIRLVLLFLFYFLIHEYIFDIPKNWLTNYSQTYAPNDQNNITLSIILILRWLFEFFDSLMTIFTQITAFFLISFWLFSFLYTTVLKKKMPNFKKTDIYKRMF